MNFSYGEKSPITKYGFSMNKSFDYLVAGKPILTDIVLPYSPIVQCGAAVEIENPGVENIVKAVERMVGLEPGELAGLGLNACEDAKNMI